MGASGLRQTSWPVLRVALQRQGRIHVRSGGGSGWERRDGGGDKHSNSGGTYTTSVWLQWGPGGVTFTLWMFLKWIPCKVCRHRQRSSVTTGAPAGRRDSVRGLSRDGHPPAPVPSWGCRAPGRTCCAPAGGHQEQEQQRGAEEPGGGGGRGAGHGVQLGGSLRAAGRRAGGLAERVLWLPEPGEALLSRSDRSRQPRTRETPRRTCSSRSGRRARPRGPPA